MAKRHYKKNRKSLSAFDLAYKSYSILWSKEFGVGSAGRMDREEFLFHMDAKGISDADKESLLREARQRVASAANKLTTEQAKNLKRALLSLSDDELKKLELKRSDVKATSLASIRNFHHTKKGEAKDPLSGSGMISKYYEYLKATGLTESEAGEQLHDEIYGGDSL